MVLGDGTLVVSDITKGGVHAVDPASGAHRHTMRLSYATLTPDRLDEACRRLARALDRCGAATMAG